MPSEPIKLTNKVRNKYNFTSRYPTICCMCGDPLENGEMIIFCNNHTNEHDPAHFSCHDGEVKRKKAITDNLASFAHKLAKELRLKYKLTYACSVSLEGTINNMTLHYGMSEEPIRDILTDLLDNLDFVAMGHKG